MPASQYVDQTARSGRWFQDVSDLSQARKLHELLRHIRRSGKEPSNSRQHRLPFHAACHRFACLQAIRILVDRAQCAIPTLCKHCALYGSAACQVGQLGADFDVVSKKICNDGVPHPNATERSLPTDPNDYYYYPAFRVLKVEHPKELLVDPVGGQLVWPVEVELQVFCEGRGLIDASQKFALYQWPIEPHSWYVARTGWPPDGQTRTGENQFKWELYVGAVIGLLFSMIATMVNKGLLKWPKWGYWEDEIALVVLVLGGLSGLCVGVIAGMGSRFFLMTDVWVQHLEPNSIGPARALWEGLLGAVVGVIGLMLSGAVCEIAIKTVPKILKVATKLRGHNWTNRTSKTEF